MAELKSVTKKRGASSGGRPEHKGVSSGLPRPVDLFVSLAEHSPHMIFINHQGRVVYANSKCEKIMGYTRKEMCAPDFNYLTLIAPEFRAKIKEDLRRHQQGEAVPAYEYFLLTKEGKRIEALITTQLIGYQEGKAILGIITDISKRKHAEEVLRTSEIRYRRLFESTQDGILILDADSGQITDVNPFVISKLGYSREEFLGKRLWEIGAFKDIKESRALFKKLQKEGYIRYEDLPLRTSGGQYLDVEFVSNVYLVNHHKVIQCNIRVITERKKEEQKLAEEPNLLLSLMDNIPDAIYFKDAESRFIQINQAQARRFGLSDPAPAAGKTDFDFFAEEHARLAYEDEQTIIRSGQPLVDKEEKETWPDGRLGWVSTTKMPLRNHEGQIIGTFGISRDITERKKAEESLRQSETRFRAIYENSQDAIGVSKNGVHVFGNPAYLKLFGYPSEEELIGRPVIDLIATDQRPTILENIRLRANKEAAPAHYQTRGLRFTGGEFDIDVRASTYELGGERFTLVIMRDISEWLQRERERVAIISLSAALRQAQNRAELLPAILDQMIALTDADGAALGLFDAGSGETVIELGRGSLEPLSGMHLPAAEGTRAQGMAGDQPNLYSEPRFKQPGIELQATACWPLSVQRQTIGTLWIGRDAGIPDRDMHLLTAMADIAANAIHRVSLHEQTQRQVQRLASLHTIDTAISASLDIGLTLDVFLDQVMARQGVDAAVLFLFNPHTQTLEYAAGKGQLPKQVVHSPLRLGEGIIGRTALERRLIAIPDMRQSEETAAQAALCGEEFRTCIAVPLIAKGQVEGVLATFDRLPRAPDAEWLKFLETLATQVAIAIDHAGLFVDLQHSHSDLIQAYDSTLEGWSRAMDMRDKETEGHTLRVTQMTMRLARRMGIAETELAHIRRGALLHDIGKMGIPDDILLKPGPLTDEEWKIMRYHPVLAFELLAPIAYLQPALDVPYCHHEKWNGSGYPRGLKGESIPLAARLFAVVDVWDALSSDRPYRLAWPKEKVLEEIRASSGTHFDPQVAEMFLKILEEENRNA